MMQFSNNLVSFVCLCAVSPQCPIIELINNSQLWPVVDSYCGVNYDGIPAPVITVLIKKSSFNY